MKLNERSLAALTISGIPNYMHDGIIDYYKNGWKPGSFLSAVINNNLKESFLCADDKNIYCIKEYIMWFYNYAPTGTWGYSDAVNDYIKRLKEIEKESRNDKGS